MTHKDFKQLLESRIEKTKAVLDRKASEYSTDDRLHNFKAAAAMSDCTPQKALWGMLAKHLVSVHDIVNAQVSVSPELLDEKIGDSINYLILLEAILNENNTVGKTDETPEQGGFVVKGEPRLINDEEQWVLSEKDLQKLQEWANRTKKEFLNLRKQEEPGRAQNDPKSDDTTKRQLHRDIALIILHSEIESDLNGKMQINVPSVSQQYLMHCLQVFKFIEGWV